MRTNEFTELLRLKGRELYRPMPWRDDTRPYYVLVSELMLQQTQVARVIPKFNAFIERFPDEQALAAAPLADVLTLWQGLGYNRRAKFLHDAARRIVDDFGGVFPTDAKDIVSLPGVGKNSAGAIEAYAFDRPVLYVETNIRTVYLHHFFHDDLDVDDKVILEKIRRTAPWAMTETEISSYGPKAFYWALMDYGSWLKANGVRNNSRSRQYKKQSPLEGSLRQMRGIILRELTAADETADALLRKLRNDTRFEPALASLMKDGLIGETAGRLHLTK